MDKTEVKKLLFALDATYPSFRVADVEATADAWAFLLADYDYNEIIIAWKSLAINNVRATGYAPYVDQIIAQLHRLKDTEQMSEGEAWSLVEKAIRKSSYYAEEEFAKLPPEIQKCIGSASQLHSWAIDDAYNASVVSSNFMRSYRAVCEREKEMRHMPTEARAMLENLQHLALEGN